MGHHHIRTAVYTTLNHPLPHETVTLVAGRRRVSQFTRPFLYFIFSSKSGTSSWFLPPHNNSRREAPGVWEKCLQGGVSMWVPGVSMERGGGGGAGHRLQRRGNERKPTKTISFSPDTGWTFFHLQPKNTAREPLGSLTHLMLSPITNPSFLSDPRQNLASLQVDEDESFVGLFPGGEDWKQHRDQRSVNIVDDSACCVDALRKSFVFPQQHFHSWLLLES